MLERRLRSQIVPVAGIVALIATTLGGVALTRGTWWALAWTVPAALLFGQLGFLAHDAVHNQILRSSRANYRLGLLLFNLLLGGSRGWWADKHATHHAQPNRLGTDPDIEGGVVAVSEGQARDARGFTRFMVRRQAGTIGPLLCLSVVQIHVDSARFLRRPGLRNPRVELALFSAHYGLYIGALTLTLGVGRGLVFAAVHQLLLGLYLGAAFLPNHTGMAVLEPDEALDFLHRQVVTARNIRAGRVTDYVFGGLSCQVEHHLFPVMQRRRLREAAPLVREVCNEHGIAYREVSVWDAYREVLQHLRSVGRAASGRLASPSAAGELAAPT